MRDEFNKKNWIIHKGEEHFYKEKRVNTLLEDDELTSEEAAFMMGYISS